MDICAISNKRTTDTLTLAWDLCQKHTASSYPLYATRQTLADAYHKTINAPGGFHLGCFQAGSLRAVLFGLAQAEERYLQTTGFYLPEGCGDIAEAFLDYLSTAYQGYTAHVGLPAENTTVSQVLKTHGYTLLDDAFDLRLEITGFRECATTGLQVVPVTEALLPRYLDFHERHFEDCYWNARRLGEHAANWHLYGLEEGGMFTGGLFARKYAIDAAEVYDLYAQSAPGYAALISCAIQDLAANHAPLQSVLFMAETTDPTALSTALSLGFQKHGHYRSYSKTL